MRLKMPILLILAAIAIISFIAPACGRGERLPEDLQQAEILMESKPDSAVALLRNMGYTPADGDYIYASWCLLKSCADYKAYARTIDEEILKTGTDYFIRHGDKDRKALAYYIRGAVHSEYSTGEAADNVKDLLKATKAIEGSDNHRLAALIYQRYAVALNERKWCTQAVPVFEKSIEEARKAGMTSTEVANCINISHSLLFIGDENGDYTKAIEYSEKALKTATERGSEYDKAKSLNAVATCYSRDGQFYKALSCARESIALQEKLVRDGRSRQRISYNALADAYRKVGEADSALFYSFKDLDNPSWAAKITAAQTCYIVYRDLLHDDANAVKYLTLHNQYKNEHEKFLQNSEVIASRIKVEEDEAKEAKYRSIWSGIIGVAAALLIIMATVHFFRRRIHRLDKDLGDKKEELKSGNDRLQKSEKECVELRNTLMDKDKTVMALRSEPHYLSEREWDLLTSLLDRVCNRFVSRLKAAAPDITRTELRTAALMKLGFSVSQMAVMCGVSPSSVTKGKQRLRNRLSSLMYGGEGVDEFIARY